MANSAYASVIAEMFHYLSEIVVAHLWQSLLILTVLAVFTRLVARLGAEIKASLWMHGLLLSILLPVLSSIFIPQSPALTTGSIAASENKHDQVSLNTQSQNKLEVAGGRLVQGSDAANASQNDTQVLAYLLVLLLVIMAFGTVKRLIGLVIAWSSTQGLIGSGIRVPTARYLKDYPQLGKTKLLKSYGITSPMVVGYLQPVILFPANLLEELEAQDIENILYHELGHIKRYDIWFSLLQRLITCLFWWNPLLSIFNKQINLNRELACDEFAARQTGDSSSYAQSLLNSVKVGLEHSPLVHGVSMFNKKKQLFIRIEGILDMENSSHLRGKKLGSLLGISLVVLTSTLVLQSAPFAKVGLEGSLVEQASHIATDAMNQGDAELLVAAVQANRISVIESLINDGADINTPLFGDGTALIVAVRKGNLAMVEKLIELGANPNQASRGDGNPLIIAAARNEQDIAELLLKHGAKIDAIVQGDETALINASRRGHLDMVKFLVSHKADVNLGVKVNEMRGPEYRSPYNQASSQKIRDYLASEGAEAQGAM